MSSKTYSFGYNVTIVPASHDITVSHTVQELGTHYNWSNGYTVRGAYLDYDNSDLTISGSGGSTSYTAPIYNNISPNSFRVYYNSSSSRPRMTITGNTGTVIKTIKLTAAVNNATRVKELNINGTTYEITTTGSTETTIGPIDINSNKVTMYLIPGSGTAANDYVRIFSIEAVYEPAE